VVQGPGRQHHRGGPADLTKSGFRIGGSCLGLLLVAAGPRPALGATRPLSPVERVASPSAKPRAGGTPSNTSRPAADGVLVSFTGAVSPRSRVSLTEGVEARSAGRIPGTGVFLLHLQKGADPFAVARELSRSPGIRRAEPNWLSSTDLIPDDPLFADQWGLNNTGQSHPLWDPPPGQIEGLPGADGKVDEAWDDTEGTSDTVVAVIDTGVDLSHPDLGANLWTNLGEIPGNSIDDDANGYADDVNGWDFFAGDADPQDGNGHGTHVAGIVAAVADNSVGVAGVCPGCRIMALRAGGPNGGLPLSAILQAIAYASHNGADIINMSFGNHAWSGFERNAIAATGAQGVLVVASAGNDASDNDYLLWRRGFPVGPSYPASFDLPNLITVAASTDRDFYGYRTGCFARTGSAGCLFTDWGRTSVDLAAPGVDIESTWLGGGYQVEDGTSMAAPFVSGVAGLVKSQNPAHSPTDVKNAILNSVDHPVGLRGRYSVTRGRVDASAALSGSTAEATPTTDGTMAGAVRIAFKRFGSLSLPGDINDIYRRRLVKGRRYVVSLRVPKGRDFDLYIWKPGTVDTWPISYGCGGISCQLRRAGLKGNGQDENIVFTPGKTGVYYLHVTAVNRRGGYVLTVAVGAHAR
jgi:subtilisin family serine protease